MLYLEEEPHLVVMTLDQEGQLPQHVLEQQRRDQEHRVLTIHLLDHQELQQDHHLPDQITIIEVHLLVVDLAVHIDHHQDQVADLLV